MALMSYIVISRLRKVIFVLDLLSMCAKKFKSTFKVCVQGQLSNHPNC